VAKPFARLKRWPRNAEQEGSYTDALASKKPLKPTRTWLTVVIGEVPVGLDQTFGAGS
jgi:hypothetical protein